jgi:hypothetical protein
MTAEGEGAESAFCPERVTLAEVRDIHGYAEEIHRNMLAQKRLKRPLSHAG